MSDDEQLELARAIRARFLKLNALHYTDGLYVEAGRAAGKGRTRPQMLAELARKIAGNVPMTIDERAFLMRLLPDLAGGVDVRAKLRIDAPKVGHNPPQRDLNADIVRELRQRATEGQCTKSGEPNAVAFAAVGRLVGKDAGAVRKIWERKRTGQ